MKFELGQILETPTIRQLRYESNEFNDFVRKSFERHCDGDWGDLCKEDKQLNDNGLKRGDDRLFSKYNYKNGVSIYVITEWDRSATTVLFPEEY